MVLEKLKSLRLWVIWKREEVNGRLTKVPYSPKDNRKCGTNKPNMERWTTFEEAEIAKQKCHADGVGFVLPTGFFFLDIDHADLKSDERILAMLERFDSYAEKSQSGEGLHIYGVCDLKKIPGVIQDESGNFVRDEKGNISFDRDSYYMKNPNNGMELYLGGITNRFAAFTGDAVNDLGINECTEAVSKTLKTEMRKNIEKNTETKKKEDFPMVANDAVSVVNDLKRFKNGDNFSRLYDGDTSGYASQSEADLALCSMIAFRTGDDPPLIDEVYKGSGLYRKKWERKDYREGTIKKR